MTTPSSHHVPTAEEIADAGVALLERGLPIVPCDGKNPGALLGKRWHKKKLTAQLLRTLLLCKAKKPAIGVKLGPEAGFIDIEADGPEEERLFADLFANCEPAVTPTHKSPRGKHRFFKYDERFTGTGAGVINYRNGGKAKLGVRVGADGKGAQSVIPPSPGREWLVSLDECDPAPLPEPVIQRLLDACKAASKTTKSASTSSRSITPLGVHQKALTAMLRITVEDGKDGSKRLFVAACRAVEHDLSDEAAVATIREYARLKPFPRLWTDAQILDRVRDAEGRTDVVRGSAVKMRDQLPKVLLPGGSQTITETAKRLGQLLAAAQTHFSRGEAVARPFRDNKGELALRHCKPAAMTSVFETVANLFRLAKAPGGEFEERATVCRESEARQIIAAEAFLDELPPLKVLSHCPVLIERDGKLIEVSSYDRESGVLASGQPAEKVTLEDARGLLNAVLRDFRFATPADKSRALAAMIAPAMVFGGLLEGRAPVDLGEADASQTGKGYRNKTTAAIYRQTPRTVTQRQGGGVGSLEESFSAALISGATFVALDNVRGRLDSPAVESFMTEDVYYARAPYTSNTEIDPKRVVVMFTSNEADLTRDFANRCSCVRLLKQPADYQFSEYPEGDLVEHVRVNQPRYLGAIFAIVREWFAQGKPQTCEARHDYRAWARPLDWIVQNLLEAAPLLEGHRETQTRMTNPAMTWLRSAVLAIARNRRLDDWLIAADILEIIDLDGSIEIPGLRDGDDLGGDIVRRGVLQQIGRKLKQCFRDADEVALDSLVIEREEWSDTESRPRLHYKVSAVNPADDPGNDPADVPTDAPAIPTDEPTDATAEGEEEPPSGTRPAANLGEPTDNPTDNPLIDPLIKPREPTDPTDRWGPFSHARKTAPTDGPEWAFEKSMHPSVGQWGSVGTAAPDACPKCRRTGHRDTPIHGGRSTRRDCARCGHTLGFPMWHGAITADESD